MTEPVQEARSESQPRADQVDAINHLFAELELAYHNQYHKAFPTEESVKMAKQLWHDALQGFSPAAIVRAGRSAIQKSEYLPSLHSLQKECYEQLEDFGLPDTLSAYREACQSGRNKLAQAWSHPAVYFAGKATDWFLLASEPATRTMPIFQHHYAKLCERVIKGETLTLPAQPKLEPPVAEHDYAPGEKLARIQELRRTLKL